MKRKYSHYNFLYTFLFVVREIPPDKETDWREGRRTGRKEVKGRRGDEGPFHRTFISPTVVRHVNQGTNGHPRVLSSNMLTKQTPCPVGSANYPT